MPRSLRARLVLVFAVGAAISLALCLVLLYMLLDRQLRAALDEGLADRSHDLAAAVSAGDAGVLQQDPLAQLYAADGTLLVGSPSLGGERLLRAEQVRTLSGETFVTRSFSLRPGGGRVSVRLLSQRIFESPSPWIATWA